MEVKSHVDHSYPELYNPEANEWMLEQVRAVEERGETKLYLSKESMDRYAQYSVSTVYADHLTLPGQTALDLPEGLVARFGDVSIYLATVDWPKWSRVIGRKKAK